MSDIQFYSHDWFKIANPREIQKRNDPPYDCTLHELFSCSPCGAAAASTASSATPPPPDTHEGQCVVVGPLLYLLVWGQLAVRIFKFNKYLGKVNSTVILQSSHPTLSHDGIRLSPTITTRGFYLNILHFQGQNESRHSNHRLADFNVETIFHETELKDVPGSVKIGIENIKAKLPSIIKSFSTINHKSSMKLKCR